MDKITIKGAYFSCNIGVSPAERSKKQKIIIDVESFLDIRKAAETDDLKDTVNYSEVYKLLKNIAEKNKHALIEALAENIAKEIINKFPIKNVTVKVKKPEALAGRKVNYVAVEIARSKNG